jgi:hypothetical protein
MENRSSVEFIALKFSTLISIIIIGFFILLAIFFINDHVNNTTQMLYWVIFIGSLFTFLAIFLFWKTKIQITIEFDSTSFIIKDQKGNKSSLFRYQEVENYNLYNLPIKKMGVILRIHKVKDSFYWLVFENNSFWDNIGILRNNLQNKLSSKKVVFVDYIIKGLFSLPIVLLVMSILILIGGFVYIIYFLK